MLARSLQTARRAALAPKLPLYVPTRMLMNDHYQSQTDLFMMTHFEIPDVEYKQPSLFEDEEGIQVKGRNSRRPKKANHGARPCSSVMRKMKTKFWFNKVKGD